MEVKTFEDEGITFIKLKNKVGLELTLCSFGASVYKIEYKGKVMSLSPVSHDQFYSSGIKFGKTVGPIAGRVKGGKILIGGEEVTLPHNEGNNTNHSGGRISTRSRDSREPDRDVSSHGFSGGRSIEMLRPPVVNG